MRSSAAFLLVFTTSLACGQMPASMPPLDMKAAPQDLLSPPPAPVLDPSCNDLASELATCRDSTDPFKNLLSCKISAASVAKCKDICKDPAQCEIPSGTELGMLSNYLGEYSLESGFQNIPEDWPSHISTSFGTGIEAAGIPLFQKRSDPKTDMAVTLIEKNNGFVIVGAVRHYAEKCAQSSASNMEVFVLKGSAKGTGKQLGCLPMEVTHTYLPLQWCDQASLPKAKSPPVQFTTVWKRILQDVDRCAP